MDISKLITDNVLGRLFKSTRFSAVIIGTIVTAGVLGPIAPIALPWIWGGIGAYMLSETALKIVDAKTGKAESDEDSVKAESVTDNLKES